MDPDDLDRTPGPDHKATRTPNAWIHDPAVRRYIYLGIAMVVAGLIMFGVVTQEQVAQWAETTVAILGILVALLAARNVPPAAK